MARKCQLTGGGPRSGNTVSHAHNKHRRRFLPNLQKVSLYSDALGRKLSVKIKVGTLRSIEAKGGIDAWLLAAKDLTPQTKRLRNMVLKAVPSPSNEAKSG